MIWATFSSWSCFCWLYRASPFGCEEYNLSAFGIDHLVMSMCGVLSCVVGRGYLLWPLHSLGRTLLAFDLLHFVLQDQTCLLFQVSLDFLLLHSSPLWWKGHLFLCLSSRRSYLCEVAQSCPTVCDPMDYSLPGSSIHEIFQARVLEWGAVAFSEKSIYFCFIDYTKAFDCMDHNKLKNS